MRVWSEPHKYSPAVAGVLNDLARGTPAAVVRRELASAAVRLADTHDVTPLVRVLMSRTEDANDPLIPHLTWLAYEKVLTKKAAENPAKDELAWLAKQAPDNQFVRDQIVPKVMRRLVATGRPADLALCVQFLADVTDAHTREKAMDGLAVALQDQMVDAPPAWAAVQANVREGNDPRLVRLADKLAVNFRDPAALKRAHAAVHDDSLPADRRAEALRQVVQMRHPDALPLVRSLLRTAPDLRLRVEAARLLATFDTPAFGAEAVRDWKTLPKEVRGELVNSLASRKPWAKALLEGMKAGVVDQAEVTNNTITRIQAFRDQELNRLIETAWGRTRPTPKELDELIAKVRGELTAGSGSFARGKQVFANQCAKCHKFDGTGADVGPPLDGAGRDIEYILANVIDPNRVIGAPYFLRIATTADGRVEQGVLAAEDDQSITLKVEQGVLKRIAKADLDGPVKVVEKSMMPEGLTAGMSVQDFRDLVRYVMASPYLTDVTVDGKPTAAGVTGMIPLPTSDKPVTVTATVTAAGPVSTQLLVGSVDPWEATLDGKPIGGGPGQGRSIQPDREGVPVMLSPGTHTLTLTVKHKGATKGVYARLLDPDRKLSYAEGK